MLVLSHSKWEQPQASRPTPSPQCWASQAALHLSTHSSGLPNTRGDTDLVSAHPTAISEVTKVSVSNEKRLGALESLRIGTWGVGQPSVEVWNFLALPYHPSLNPSRPCKGLRWKLITNDPRFHQSTPHLARSHEHPSCGASGLGTEVADETHWGPQVPARGPLWTRPVHLFVAFNISNW